MFEQMGAVLCVRTLVVMETRSSFKCLLQCDKLCDGSACNNQMNRKCILGDEIGSNAKAFRVFFVPFFLLYT